MKIFVQVSLINISRGLCLNLFALDPCDVNSADNSIQFDENTPPGTTLFRLPFEEPHHIHSVEMHSAELANLDQLFLITNSNRLKLKAHYDLEMHSDFIEIEFICRSKPINGQVHRNTFLLYVTINDVNDKTPQFLHTPYKFYLKEVFNKIRKKNRKINFFLI